MTVWCSHVTWRRMEGFFGVHEHELPSLRILDLDHAGAKYKFNHTITKRHLVQWLSDFKAGNLHVRSPP